MVGEQPKYRFEAPDGRVVIVEPMGDGFPGSWFVWREDDPSGTHGGGPSIAIMAASVLGHNIAVDEPPLQWLGPWVEEIDRKAKRLHARQKGHTLDALDLLPWHLGMENRMEREIALPYPAVEEAVGILEAEDVLLLGWEPLASFDDGGFGAYPGPGLGGLAGIAVPNSDSEWQNAVREAAAAHRETIESEWQTRETTPPRAGVELIFCLTGLTHETWHHERSL